MRNDPFMRTYSPRQEAMARAAGAQHTAAASTQSAAAITRPAAATGSTPDVLAPYRVNNQPYYRPVADEVELYEAAYSVRMPIMLKGPTGCGKTRFVEYMA